VAPSAMAVGGFQMENNFLLFNEAASKFQARFSGTLLFRTTCGNLTSPQGHCPGDLYPAAVAGECTGELCAAVADARGGELSPAAGERTGELCAAVAGELDSSHCWRARVTVREQVRRHGSRGGLERGGDSLEGWDPSNEVEIRSRG
jgi:hypothetical protein